MQGCFVGAEVSRTLLVAVGMMSTAAQQVQAEGSEGQERGSGDGERGQVRTSFIRGTDGAC